MKNRFIMLFISVLIFQACMPTEVLIDKDYTTLAASYDIILNRVESPSNNKEQFSELITKPLGDNDISNNVYEDSIMKIIWYYQDNTFYFSLYNKTSHTLKVNWNDVAFIDPFSRSSRVIHNGIDEKKFNEIQASSLAPKNASYEDFVTPPTIYFKTIFYDDESLSDAKKLEGKEVKILFPISFENVQNDYTFTFLIDKVNTSKVTRTNKIHDITAEQEAREKNNLIASFSIIGCLTLATIIMLNKLSEI